MSVRKLHLAATIAPSVRAAYERERELLRLADDDTLPADVTAAISSATRRNVHAVDKTGAVVRDLTRAEFAVAVAVVSDLAFGTVDGAAQQTVCAGFDKKCGERPPKGAFSAQRIRQRGGAPWRCRRCTASKREAGLTQQRSDQATAMWEQRTTEQRREIGMKVAGKIAPERRSEIARKKWTRKTPEQRSEIARQRVMAMTPEQRSELAKRRWATRRAKAAGL